MVTYHQLPEYQRYQIYALKKADHDQQTIAATLEVSTSMDVDSFKWQVTGRL